MITPSLAIFLAAKKVGVSLKLLLAICTVETGLKNIHNYNDGHSHSWGICQVKTQTAIWAGKVTEWKELLTYTDKDLQDNRKNAFAAAVYLKYQLDRYNGDEKKAISAYNAGRYIDGNRDYVAKVIGKKNDFNL